MLLHGICVGDVPIGPDAAAYPTVEGEGRDRTAGKGGPPGGGAGRERPAPLVPHLHEPRPRAIVYWFAAPEASCGARRSYIARSILHLALSPPRRLPSLPYLSLSPATPPALFAALRYRVCVGERRRVLGARAVGGDGDELSAVGYVRLGSLGGLGEFGSGWKFLAFVLGGFGGSFRCEFGGE